MTTMPWLARLAITMNGRPLTGETAYHALAGADAVTPGKHSIRQRWQEHRKSGRSEGSEIAPDRIAERMYVSKSLALHRLSAYTYFAKKERRLDVRLRPSPLKQVMVNRNKSIPRLSWVAQRRYR